MWNYILFCFVKVMFWLHKIGILHGKKRISVQLWAWRLVYLLDITYSKIIENVILVDIFLTSYSQLWEL